MESHQQASYCGNVQWLSVDHFSILDGIDYQAVGEMMYMAVGRSKTACCSIFSDDAEMLGPRSIHMAQGPLLCARILQ